MTAGCVTVEEGVAPNRVPVGAFPNTILALPKIGPEIVPLVPLTMEFPEDAVAWPKMLVPPAKG